MLCEQFLIQCKGKRDILRKVGDKDMAGASERAGHVVECVEVNIFHVPC